MKSSAGQLRYLGEKIYSGFERITDEDKEGEPRQAIVFRLVQADAVSGDDIAAVSDASLTELAAQADSDLTEETAPRHGLSRTYARSAALRRYVRRRAGGRCEGCGADAPFRGKDGLPFLEAHHTLRRSDSGPGRRQTVIALCPNCHTRVHYGADGDTYNEELKSKLPEIEEGLIT
jgi:5-methylcytosine-specific restriction protein A